jgi:hypothetical protein
MTATQELQWTNVTSQCTCTVYDETTETESESEECFGFCWEDAMNSFEGHCGDFFDGSKHDYHFDNFGRWDGGYSGCIPAKTGREFIQKLTDRIGDWSGWYVLTERNGEPTLLFTLSHHDSPTGRTMEIVKREYQD